MQQTLRKEEQQSKERASVVMNKIMTASGPDMKVIVIHHKRQEKKDISSANIHKRDNL